MALTLPVRMSCWVLDELNVQARTTAYALIDRPPALMQSTRF